MAKKKKKMNVTPNVLLNITWQKYEYLFFFNKKNECHRAIVLILDENSSIFVINKDWKYFSCV
jgi:hypothetical protein